MGHVQDLLHVVSINRRLSVLTASIRLPVEDCAITASACESANALPKRNERMVVNERLSERIARL